MPIAGEGKRFKEAGYTVPKPFIDIHGVSMYRQALGDFYGDGDNVIIIAQDDHYSYFEAEPEYQITPKKIYLSGPTEGAACSVLQARAFIDNDLPLLIVNCDQRILFNRFNWATLVNNSTVDGVIFVFNTTGNKWSYVGMESTGRIVQVAEKVEISRLATCGAYWFRHGRAFVAAADQMIAKNIRTNNEFFIAPVYNEIIAAEGHIVPFAVNQMISLGTPECLENYLKIKRIHCVDYSA